MKFNKRDRILLITGDSVLRMKWARTVAHEVYHLAFELTARGGAQRAMVMRFERIFLGPDVLVLDFQQAFELEKKRKGSNLEFEEIRPYITKLK